MRNKLIFCVLALCMPASGCATIALGTQNLLFEVETTRDDCLERARNRQLAHAGWEEFNKANAGQEYSSDYGDGFMDGFADFLEAGGTGKPPALPPARYYRVKYQTPQGWHAIEDWYTGFRTGAASARASGYRQFVVFPVNLAGPIMATPPPACGPAPVGSGILPAPPLPRGPFDPVQTPPALPSNLPTPRKYLPAPVDRGQSHGGAESRPETLKLHPPAQQAILQAVPSQNSAVTAEYPDSHAVENPFPPQPCGTHAEFPVDHEGQAARPGRGVMFPTIHWPTGLAPIVPHTQTEQKPHCSTELDPRISNRATPLEPTITRMASGTPPAVDDRGDLGVVLPPIKHTIPQPEIPVVSETTIILR